MDRRGTHVATIACALLVFAGAQSMAGMETSKEFKGELRISMASQSNGTWSTPQHHLFTNDGAHYTLIYNGSLSSGQWTTGMQIKVTVQGQQNAAAVSLPPAGTSNVRELHVVSVVQVQPANDAIPHSTPTATSRAGKVEAAAVALGTAPASLAVLFIIITMCEQAASITPEDASTMFFGGSSGTGPHLKGWFEGCSMGQTTLSPTASRVVSVSLPCSGPSPWNYDWNSQTCDEYAYAAAANKAVEDYGLATAADYAYKAYILPVGSPCGALWGGWGEWKCGTNCYTWYNHQTATYLSTYPELLGYNLNLGNARQDSDNFGDKSSAMSVCCTSTTRCFNTPNTWQLGWATAVATITTDTLAPSNTVAVTLPRADTATANMAQIVAGWLGTPAPMYWVGYRGDSSGYNGYDADLPSAYAKVVNVYRWDGPTYNDVNATYHLAALSTHRPTTWSVDSLVVRLVGIDASAGSAVVAICRAGGSTEISCSDGLDNDCDGLIDMADPDCVPLPPRLANEDPNAAFAVPSDRCGIIHTATIPPRQSYQTVNVLSSCGPGDSRGGLHYSFGPFAIAGTLLLNTSGDGGCRLGSDTTLSLYHGTSRACIAGNDDSAQWCSALSYDVTADQASAGATFIVKLGLVDDYTAANATFLQTIQFSAYFTCSRPLPSPPPALSPSPPPAGPWSKNGRCGANGGRTWCRVGGCCSRWGWCGTSAVHCDTTQGCNKAFGACPKTSTRPAGRSLDTNLEHCGGNTRCRSGYCCARLPPGGAVGRCSKLDADCNPATVCIAGYGLCYASADELQSAIDLFFDDAGAAGAKYATNFSSNSNATRLSLYSFGLATPATTSVCRGKTAPCIGHAVTAGQTLEHVAATYGTTTWQLLLDNELLAAVGIGTVPLRTNDVLAVRPSPGNEKRVRWLWPKPQALLLGSSAYPRPCSGYTSELEKKSCFCHYHQGTGTYVWPFSTGDRKCRDAIECKYAVSPNIQKSCGGVVDDLEFNGLAQCVDKPSGFECSTGDGCTTVYCLCKEFLLKPGIYYQNPFDSTRSTGVMCNFSQPGWYGGMLYCEGGYFDPYTGDCAAVPTTGIPSNKIPYKRGYTSCDGVPDPDLEPLAAAAGRRLQGTKPYTRRLEKACKRTSCCSARRLAAAKRYGCACAATTCKNGASSVVKLVSTKNKKCQCGYYGACAAWFNKGCKFKKPARR